MQMPSLLPLQTKLSACEFSLTDCDGAAGCTQLTGGLYEVVEVVWLRALYFYVKEEQQAK